MSEPTFRQRRLGRVLQELRERAGLSQKDIADRLHYNIAKVSRIENGQVPDYSAFETMLDFYGVIADDVAPYIEMWNLAVEKAWWHQFREEGRGYLSLEHDAIKIRMVEPCYIPGLLQTRSYMRALFSGSRTPRSKKWIEQQIAIRERRQRRLHGDDPLQLHVVIGEATMVHADRRQLLHLNGLAELNNVTIQVLLDSAGLHDGHNGGFTVLDFPYPGDPQVLYVEYSRGSFQSDDPALVQAASLDFKHLSKLALTPDQSAAWIERLATER
ncbi:helix-turn-helix transcriptional regulator [Lentzea sp. NPDC006480]|uniref:helix-turn-helix domain-containing protein n=1 Tax=Lentzea sp. NPDC006480 TaxID=3157176 RepID=UPI0033A71FD0